MRNGLLKRAGGVLLACLLALPGGSALGAADGYRTSRYVERGYTAYAFAEEAGPGTLSVEVFLQFLAGYAAEDSIAGYALYADGARAGEIGPAQAGSGTPVHFSGTVPVSRDMGSLSLVPVLAQGGELEAEAVDLTPALAEGSCIGSQGVVNNPNPEDRLNLRTGPSSNAESLRHYYNGVAVDILGEAADGWLAVAIGSGNGMARGYMKADFLALGDAAKEVASVIPTLTAAVATWSLYAFPDESSQALGTYSAGQAFELLGESSAWWHIRVEGQTGFVRADVLTHPPEESAAPEATDVPTETSAQAVVQEDGLRLYTAKSADSPRFTLEAEIKEISQGQFDIGLVLRPAEGYGADDEIVKYHLYVNGEKLCGVPNDPDAYAQGGTVFHTQTAIEGTITGLVMTPEWAKGGELAEGTVAFRTE